MPPYELTTLMRIEAPGYMPLPERFIPLPLLPEIKIHTYYTPCFGDGLWETNVVGINPDGKDFLIESCATLDSPDKQHDTFVVYYRSKGYKIVEQLSGAVR